MVIFYVIMAVTYYLILLLVRYMMKEAEQPARNLLFGVSLSHAGLKDERVQELCRSYRRVVRRLMWVLFFSFPFIFLIKWFSIQTILLFAWILLPIALCYVLFYHYNKKMSLLKQQHPGLQPEAGDADHLWKYGFIYYDPDPKARWLETTRIGFGSTINMARTSSKIIMGISLLLMLSVIPLMGELVAEEFTSITYEVSEKAIIIRHLKKEAEIPVVDIISTELIEALPDTTKSTGSSLPNCYKGRFYVKGYKGCDLYLDPREEPFLFLETEEGKYILNYTDEIKEIFI